MPREFDINECNRRLRLLIPGDVACHVRDERDDHAVTSDASAAHVPEPRRGEFAAGRACARAALAQLGATCEAPLTPDLNGAPRWPAAFTGSITHDAGVRVAVCARRERWHGIGVDVAHGPLPQGAVPVVLTPGERRQVELINAPLVVFSLKESLFKAWYAATGQRLRFADAALAGLRPSRFLPPHTAVAAGWDTVGTTVISWVGVPAC